MEKLIKNLTLIGFKSSGKTTLGKLLSIDIQAPFVDTDELIEKQYPPLSCHEIFKTFGAIEFRQIENQVILSLKDSPAIVLATGGGSLLQKENRDYLKKRSLLIYLKSSAEILKQRIWQRENLPAYFISQDPQEAFERMYQERILTYEQCADFILEMDGLGVKEALDQLKQEIILRECLDSE